MRLAIGRLLETSKLINTKAGAELSEFIAYMSDFAEQVIRALANGLTFSENMNAKVVKASLRHNVEQIINTDGKSPTGILPSRVHSSTTGLDQFSWYFNSSGQVVVKAALVGSPSAATDVSLIILFS